MKRDAVLFAYAWIGAYLLGSLLQYPAMDAMTFTRWLTASPVALVVVAAVLSSLQFLLMSALYHWLRGEGRWARDAAVAWAGLLLVELVFAAFATRFSALGLGRVVSPFQLLNLGAALLGAWLADEHAWRPALREARQWLLSTADWAR